MELKKKISCLYNSASRLLFVPVCAAGIMLGGVAATNEPQTAVTEESVQSEMTYTLREYDGKIGIFRDGNNLPDRVLDVYLITLPAADVSRLQEGINASDKAEMQALIEDFTG